MIDPATRALAIAFDFGGVDGAHHKQWVIDQMVRVLAGENYENWVTDYERDMDGNLVFQWETGIAP